MYLSICLLVVQALLVQSFRFGCIGRTPTSSTSTRRSTLNLSTASSAFDYKVDNKLPWQENGYESWEWEGKKINYVDLGGDEANKPPLLLIHGFGASVYHWRYNIPELARKYRVFAIDLLGFGLSEKPIMDYSAELWRDQVLGFIRNVVMKDRKDSKGAGCVVAGNSLGGFTALYAAADLTAKDENLISGCILLNAAGRFKPTEPVPEKAEKPKWVQDLAAAFQRFVIGVSFIYTKQPQRIAQVLRQVYPVDPSNVDDELVKSIQFPAQDPNAAEVFYRVIAKNGNGPPKFVDELLSDLKVPLLLLWGESDPWIRPQAADRIQALFPSATRVSVNAGHCPHDESPAEVNKAIDDFMAKVNAKDSVTMAQVLK
jgi:pimeloyl-ACP methyl ester carboxylesterase